MHNNEHETRERYQQDYVDCQRSNELVFFRFQNIDNKAEHTRVREQLQDDEHNRRVYEHLCSWKERPGIKRHDDKQIYEQRCCKPVSYTHLTLPTIYSV